VAFEVLDGGLLTTVQDLGRAGYERIGVPVAGAMDSFALRAANWLVGNPPGAAALEITLVGPRLRAAEKCLVAVTGADLGLRVNGWDLPPWMAFFVRQGGTIEFSGRKTGCRAVLAVAGGIDVAPVMASHSTCLSGGFGGFEGRALRRGDLVPMGSAGFHLPERAGRAFPRHLIPGYSDAPTIRVVLGPQDAYFTDEGIATFLAGEYQVSPASDRMGCRLVQQGERGGKLPESTLTRGDFISDGVPLGAVQVPPDGQPIVMLADRQTTGGYPKIATVISADIPLLAQCVPGQSSVRFEAVSVEEARASYREMMDVWSFAPDIYGHTGVMAKVSRSMAYRSPHSVT
jgi:antagonist of KipI